MDSSLNLNPELAEDLDEAEEAHIRSSLAFVVWKIMRTFPNQSFSAIELMRYVVANNLHHNRNATSYVSALAYLDSRNHVFKIHQSKKPSAELRYQVTSVTEPYNVANRKYRGEREVIIRTSWRFKKLSPLARAYSSVWRFADFWAIQTKESVL